MVMQNVNATVGGQGAAGDASSQQSVQPTQQPSTQPPTTADGQPTQPQPAQADFQARMQNLFQELGTPAAPSPERQGGPAPQERQWLEQQAARHNPREYGQLMEWRRQQAFEQAAGEATRLAAVTRYAQTLSKHGIQEASLERLLSNSSSPEQLNLEAVKIIAEHAQGTGQPVPWQPGITPPRVASVQGGTPRMKSAADMTSSDWDSLIARVERGEKVSANDLPQVP